MMNAYLDNLNDKDYIIITLILLLLIMVNKSHKRSNESFISCTSNSDCTSGKNNYCVENSFTPNTFNCRATECNPNLANGLGTCKNNKTCVNIPNATNLTYGYCK